MLDQFFADDTPQEVRDHVEVHLVDVEKVTALEVVRADPTIPIGARVQVL